MGGGLGPMLPCPIAFETLDRYASRYGFDAPEAFQEFHYLIAALDRFYIGHMAERAARKSKSDTSEAPNSPPPVSRQRRGRQPAK